MKILTLLLIVIVLHGAHAQSSPGGCLAPIEEPSKMFLNPTEVNSVFSFDYKITSHIKGLWRDDEASPTPTRQEMQMNYYVNSADGSLYMSEGYVNVMLLSSGVSMRDIMYNSMGKIEGVIRLPNGQMIILVLDRISGKKRAITVEIPALPFHLFRIQGERLDGFIDEVINNNSIEAGGRTSKASALIMRNDLWGSNGGLTQISGVWESPLDDTRYQVTMQIANRPGIEPIATNTPLVGLMTGIIKAKRSPCNYLVVETVIQQIESYMRVGDPGYDEPTLVPSEVVEAYVGETMTNIVKQHKTVDTAEYEVMRLPGNPQHTEEDREILLEEQQTYYTQLEALLKQLETCRDNEFCIARINQDILQLQKQYEGLIRSSASGPTSAATDSKNEIEARMYDIHEEIIEQERKCKTLNDQNSRCGGCVTFALERCKRDLQELEERLDDLQCALAKVMGMEDYAYDCH